MERNGSFNYNFNSNKDYHVLPDIPGDDDYDFLEEEASSKRVIRFRKKDVYYYRDETSNRKKVSSDTEMSLDSWVSSFRDWEEMREIFLNMDRAMRYLHERGYCVKTFEPTKIMILNNSLNQIKFETMPMPKDQITQRKYIKDDIYNSSFVQIGLYSNSLPYLKRDFLKSNFDSFAQFVPEGDVPYYRGVIDRGASVYFCEYAMEKVNRDLASLEAELSGENGMKPSVKPNIKKYDDTGINDRINDSIYKEISKGRRDAAFINFLIYPTAILALGFVLALIAWFMSFV